MGRNENVGVALALVFGAGASTAVGAAVVFFPALVKMTSRRVLASSLGFSAGVMSYVSFVEIFTKSTASFEDAGFSESDAYLYSTLCFFGGVISMIALNSVVMKLMGGEHHHHEYPEQPEHVHQHETPGATSANQPADSNTTIGAPCCSNDPVGDLEKIQKMGQELEAKDANSDDDNGDDNDNETPTPAPAQEPTTVVANENAGNDEPDGTDGAKPLEGQERLVRMGINTALAIGLHNFPEGLATFVAALDDPTVGAILAFAIAIHNIPEGLCVALPIYYATGNRVNAFLWALLSGASEFVAALLGWAILANSFSDTLYAVLFGLVGGMMVIISVRELLPTAHFYDPEDTVVTHSFIGGMALMAASLVLFVV